ncbi:hypothetical protein KUTeg_015841, partial [Tegillarca granosa]
MKPITEVTGWTKDLSNLPDVESCDIMLYLLKCCGWSDTKLRRYKSDDGYRLHLENHVDNVEYCSLLDLSYFYIRSTCIPQTRQNETPYTVWILITSDGEIM